MISVACSDDGVEDVGGDAGSPKVVAGDLHRAIGGYGQGPSPRQSGDQLTGTGQRDDSGAGVGGHEFADLLGEHLWWDRVTEQVG
jgi:hypothetical protein